MTTQELIGEMLGKNGYEIVTDTVTRTGKFGAVSFFADSVVHTLTSRLPASGTSNNINTVTNIPAGCSIVGEFTAFKLTSGQAILHKSNW